MRYLIPLAILIVAQIGAAWAVGDNNVARLGGSYATVEAETAAACERHCADDTLCMAWSFHANACELKAIVPAAVTETGVISGVSVRAPASMRALVLPAPAPQTVAMESEPPPPQAETDDTVALALLGGPEDEQGLRSRLGN